ncbi:hypothetical protein QQZ08_010101 [Neonectria magnoliae]|uniref:Uncharacterized protein n=1 Tax=Neonectria magnoliae TaxID=2732573 RepID=A0ABR1HJV7_9HYPO
MLGTFPTREFAPRTASIYGCLLAKLQTTVRSFYDIDGTDVSDWASGCFCPCVTLVRSENEILHREREAHRTKNSEDRDSSVAEQYSSPPQMVHPLELEKYRSPAPMEHSLASGNRSEPVSPDDGDAEPDTRTLPAIPEVGREPSAAGVVRAHDLKQDLDVYPINRDRSAAHGLEEDAATLANPPTINTSHELGHDATVTQVAAPTKGHPIELDRRELLSRPKATAKEHSNHDIHHDQIVPEARLVTTHDLQKDAVTPPLRRSPALHSLDADETTLRRVGSRRAHELPDDK